MAIRIIAPPPQAAPKPMGVGEDMARSGQTGLLEGVAGLAGSIGDVRDMGERAVKWGAEKFGVKGSNPMDGGFSPTAIISATAAKLAEKAGMSPAAAKVVGAVASPGPLRAPTSGDLLKATDEAGVKRHTPQTRAGKYTRTVMQFGPGAATPGGPARKVASVLIPGIASEGAGQIAEGQPYEAAARMAGGMLGMTGVALAGRGGPDTRLLSQASNGATDAQIAMARDLMDRGAQQGVQITMAEALQQVTGGGTGMGRLQRVIEGTRGGNERIGPVMAQRPGQVSGAVDRFADSLGPAPADPYMAAGRAQEAATGVLNGVRQEINANARPWYDALQTETMPRTPAYQRLLQDPAYQEAFQAVRNDPIMNREIANLADDSLAVVDKVVQHLDTLAENSRPNPAASTGNAARSAAYTAARGTADELASAYSEPWRLSRSMVASGREAFLEPLQVGPMGAISKTNAPGGQTGALFPAAPPEGAAAITGQTMEMLPPQVSGDLARRHITSSFNEAAQQNIPGENQWGGAKWAAGVAGNPEQAAALRSGVVAAGGDRQNLDALLEVLRATGKRERPGSMTAYNARDLEELGQAGVAGEVMRTGLNPPGVFRRIGQGFQDWQTERNAGRLAEAIVANPAEAERILLRARQVVPPGQELQLIERAALAAQLSRQPEQARIGAQ